MISNTILLTGLPRAGTTLSCHILNSCPNTLALHEPMRPVDFTPAAGIGVALEYIAHFAASTREQVLNEGKALSQQKNGAVPENPVASSAIQNGLRPMDVSLDFIDVSARHLNPEFNLVIKHNALFTALLPELAEQFPVYAIVRNPLAVLASWNLVDLPVNRGHIPAAEQFDVKLKRQLADTPDALDRQLHILEWFCHRYCEHLAGRWLRYEEFVVAPEQLVTQLNLPAPMTPIPIRDSKNSSYELPLMEHLYSRLWNFGEAIWAVYSRDQVSGLMEKIRGA